jgi:hypothetical protein
MACLPIIGRFVPTAPRTHCPPHLLVATKQLSVNEMDVLQCHGLSDAINLVYGRLKTAKFDLSMPIEAEYDFEGRRWTYYQSFSLP